ncbi:MAG: glycosyltransferase family 4 protein [Pseudomonadota bacterium]
MRILLTSVAFEPSVGGIETVTKVLAEAFTSAGHEVTIATQTPGGRKSRDSVAVLRQPSPRALLTATRRADVVLQNQISLRLGWPTALLRRPCVVAHHMWTGRGADSGLKERVKHAIFPLVRNIACSQAMAKSIAPRATVIPNPYANHQFRVDHSARRERDLVFLGRLLPAKGLHVALDALVKLRSHGATPTLTVIGEGIAEAELRAQVASSGLSRQVRFVGLLRGTDLVRTLNEHRLLLVPSIWDEPFGVVALEGLACGLVPIVSDSGGLPDAAGPCGRVVPRADPAALETAISSLLADDGARREYLMHAPEHLARHTPENVASSYLQVLSDAVAGGVAP